jgi:hypothetical protein
MHDTASRDQTKGGGLWKAALIVPQESVSRGGEQPAALEFYVTNGDGAHQDRPMGGGVYRCHTPGAYKLQSGRLVPFPKAREARVMVVSDIDGTMVGEGQEADNMTLEFMQVS